MSHFFSILATFRSWLGTIRSTCSATILNETPRNNKDDPLYRLLAKKLDLQEAIRAIQFEEEDDKQGLVVWIWKEAQFSRPCKIMVPFAHMEPDLLRKVIERLLFQKLQRTITVPAHSNEADDRKVFTFLENKLEISQPPSITFWEQWDNENIAVRVWQGEQNRCITFEVAFRDMPTRVRRIVTQQLQRAQRDQNFESITLRMCEAGRCIIIPNGKNGNPLEKEIPYYLEKNDKISRLLANRLLLKIVCSTALRVLVGIPLGFLFFPTLIDSTLLLNTGTDPIGQEGNKLLSLAWALYCVLLLTADILKPREKHIACICVLLSVTIPAISEQGFLCDLLANGLQRPSQYMPFLSRLMPLVAASPSCPTFDTYAAGMFPLLLGIYFLAAIPRYQGASLRSFCSLWRLPKAEARLHAKSNATSRPFPAPTWRNGAISESDDEKYLKKKGWRYSAASCIVFTAFIVAPFLTQRLIIPSDANYDDMPCQLKKFAPLEYERMVTVPAPWLRQNPAPATSQWGTGNVSMRFTEAPPPNKQKVIMEWGEKNKAVISLTIIPDKMVKKVVAAQQHSKTPGSSQRSGETSQWAQLYQFLAALLPDSHPPKSITFIKADKQTLANQGLPQRTTLAVLPDNSHASILLVSIAQMPGDVQNLVIALLQKNPAEENDQNTVHFGDWQSSTERSLSPLVKRKECEDMHWNRNSLTPERLGDRALDEALSNRDAKNSQEMAYANYKDLLDQAWKELQYIVGFYDRIYTLRASVFTIDLGILGFFIAQIARITKENDEQKGTLESPWEWARDHWEIAIPSLWFLILSLLCVYRSFWPILDGGISLILFQKIQDMPHAWEYIDQYSRQTYIAHLEDILAQTWRHSRIIYGRYTELQESIFYLFCSLFPGAMTLFAFHRRPSAIPRGGTRDTSQAP